MPGTLNAGDLLTDALTAEVPWTLLTPINGWLNNVSPQPKWRFLPLLNMIELFGALQSGTITNNTPISANLSPAPAHTSPVQLIQVNVATTGGGPGLVLTSAGSPQVFDLPTGTTLIVFHVFFPLDA